MMGCMPGGMLATTLLLVAEVDTLVEVALFTALSPSAGEAFTELLRVDDAVPEVSN